jgi:Replication protein
MRSPPGELERENPDTLAGEIGVQGIEGLQKRVSRYGKAKTTALDVAEYIGQMPEHQAVARRLQSCGDYLVFRHYFTVDVVKLHGASLCMKHLLCPLCAIRRGAKALKAYLDRWDAIQAENASLRPFLVTLTVKDGPDLSERFQHLFKAQHELWKRKLRGRGSVLDGVTGAVWSYEVKRGSGSGTWHPHLHMIALAETMPDQVELSAEWHNITGDSFIVDVRPISQQDPVSGFVEVFKYAVKFSDQPPADTLHAWLTLRGKRLLGSAGCFRGVVVPESLLDDPEGLGELPFATLFYRYLSGSYVLGRSTKKV